MEMQQNFDKRQYIEDRPHVLQNLIYRQTSDKMYTVKNIQAGRYFKLNQETVRVMRLFNGEKSIARVSEETGLRPEIASYIVDQLRSFDLLETDQPSIESAKKLKQQQETLRWGNRWIFMRKNILTSDKWMDYVYQSMRLKYLFKPALLVVLFTLYISAAIVVYIYYAYISMAMYYLFQPDVFLLLVIPVYLLLAIPHELAHGFTCKHFGGRIQAMGVGLYYLQPAFFCDISDAWLFPKRSQRILTHAAGLLINLLFAALVILLLPFALHLYWYMEFATMVLFVVSILVIVNINPLIQLDGYYMLADILKIDNLRKKALSMLFLNISFLCRRTPYIARYRDKSSTHEQVFLLVYAVLSIVYTVVMSWLLGAYYSAWYLGRWSWIVSSLLVVIFFVLPLWKGWHRSTTDYKS